MKKNVQVILFLFLGLSLSAQWKPAGEKIKTVWASKVGPNHVLPEYPRPIMERKEWKNLNGLWNYAIQEVGKAAPEKYDGQILVPFAVESSLSGVMKEVGAKNELWYNTSFTIESNWKDQNILLHFGAVDWKTEVWLNGVKIGSHTGGYTPFSFDITPFINGKTQQLTVKVWDPSNEGPQPRGKQVKNPEGIWYTPVTGIWQTVWIEPVNKKNITAIRTTPNIDQNLIAMLPEVTGASYGDLIEITVYEDSKAIATVKASAGENLEIVLNNPKLWSPESPFLYKTKVKLISNGKVIDQVKSYFAMRKIGSKRDSNGILRIQLNNKDYFQYGPLDQGWWPDGLYTAPTDEAEQPIWQNKKYFEGNELQRTPKSEEIYKKEWKEIMDHLYSYPSIVVWVPFNEAWGQFKTVEITDWTKNHDPSRLVNSSSGGNHFQTGDILDLHNYPGPELYLYDARRVTVLGEYGGIGLAVEGHLWRASDNWGYVKFKNTAEVTNEYIKYATELKKLVKTGFSAAVYTQTTDVEGEVNGFMTYDRKVDKMDFEKVSTINKEVIDALNNKSN